MYYRLTLLLLLVDSAALAIAAPPKLDFMFTDAWGITIKHEYGRIPPAFRLVDNTTGVGLVFMFSQAGNSKQKGQP